MLSLSDTIFCSMVVASSEVFLSSYSTIWTSLPRHPPLSFHFWAISFAAFAKPIPYSELSPVIGAATAMVIGLEVSRSLLPPSAAAEVSAAASFCAAVVAGVLLLCEPPEQAVVSAIAAASVSETARFLFFILCSSLFYGSRCPNFYFRCFNFTISHQ